MPPKRQPMTRPEILVVTLIVGLALAAGYLLLTRQSNRENTRQDQVIHHGTVTYNYQSCRRGNVVRAWLLRGDIDKRATRTPDETQLARALFPIVDCWATSHTDDGHTVLLTPDLETPYIRIVLHRCRLPVVRRGRIVGSENLPRQVSCPVVRR